MILMELAIHTSQVLIRTSLQYVLVPNDYAILRTAIAIIYSAVPIVYAYDWCVSFLCYYPLWSDFAVSVDV